MKWIPFFATATVGGTLILLATQWHSKRLPDSFEWQKFEIKSVISSDTLESQVFDSVRNMRKIFDLNVGDECYFLVGKDWIWRDSKDPAIQLVPVFCPGKGGGWAIDPSHR